MSKTTFTTLFALGALALGACDDDGNTDSNTDGRLDAAVDSGLDATLDASVDADLPACTDASAPACTVDQTYSFYDDGGNSPYNDVYKVSSNWIGLTHTVSGRAGGQGSFSCGRYLTCNTYVGIDHLNAAFADPVVAAAWGDGSTLFGVDQRPVDGPALAIERQDHKKILIGAPCDGANNCTAIPPAIEKLRTLYHDLREQLSFGPQPDGGLAIGCTTI